MNKKQITDEGKKPTDWMVRGAIVLVVILVVGFVILSTNRPIAGPPVISQCYFSPVFTCVDYELQASTAKLYLKIGQLTGHTIRINGINCTQQTDTTKMTAGSYIYYPNYSPSGATDLIISSGESAVVADSIPINASTSGSPANATNIICSTSTGVMPSDVEIGSTYNGKIYINYTELDTNLTRIIVGTCAIRYRITP